MKPSISKALKDVPDCKRKLTGRKALRYLATFLSKLSDDDYNHNHWWISANYENDLQSFHTCGTAACAAGYGGAIFTEMFKDDEFVAACDYENLGVFFDIPLAASEYVFSPEGYCDSPTPKSPTPKAVAKQILQVLKEI